MPEKIRNSVSSSPSIFGSNHAIQALRLFYRAMGLPAPAFVPGMKPEMKGLSKAKLQKTKKKLFRISEASKDEKRNYSEDLVDYRYVPEALLVLGYLCMYKGVYLTTKERLQILDAIAIERRNTKTWGTASWRRQRKMQLNHFENELSLYKNGVARDKPNQLKLFHTTKGKKRAAKLARQKHDILRKDLECPMSEQDLKYWAETYTLMRMIYGATKTKDLFRKFCPRIKHKDVIRFAQSEGYLDEKFRPNTGFKQMMMGLINKRIV